MNEGLWCKTIVLINRFFGSCPGCPRVLAYALELPTKNVVYHNKLSAGLFSVALVHPTNCIFYEPGGFFPSISFYMSKCRFFLLSLDIMPDDAWVNTFAMYIMTYFIFNQLPIVWVADQMSDSKCFMIHQISRVWK